MIRKDFMTMDDRLWTPEEWAAWLRHLDHCDERERNEMERVERERDLDELVAEAERLGFYAPFVKTDTKP